MNRNVRILPCRDAARRGLQGVLLTGTGRWARRLKVPGSFGPLRTARCEAQCSRRISFGAQGAIETEGSSIASLRATSKEGLAEISMRRIILLLWVSSPGFVVLVPKSGILAPC